MSPGDRHPFTRVGMYLFFLFVIMVFLYLTRLEAHTRADILLPTNYLAGADGTVFSAGEDDVDEVDAYYQQYTRQLDRPYTIRQDLLLSRLAYIHAPPGFRGETDGVTVRALCDEIARVLTDETADAERLFGRNRQEILEIITGIREHNRLTELVICEYVSNASGLAGYVLAAEEDIILSLRGTDDVADMLDNVFLLPFNLSIQYADMRKLLERYGNAERIWLTGHSKGGHNAIYAASIDSRCRATAFNAPGFGIFLSDAQHDGLDFGVNYVINGDVTGFLLFHLERRVVLESAVSITSKGFSLNKRHRLNNFFFIDDLTVAEHIQPLSIWSEWITQLIWLLLVFLAGYRLIRLIRRLVNALIHKKSRFNGS